MKYKTLFTSLIIVSSIQGIALAEEDPAEIAIGERLFLETRFAQAYYSAPKKADPIMDKTLTTTQALKSPFAGKTMNCRACHMVDEHAENPSAGMRSYADYARRPPVPAREDGAKTSERNSMSMVNISIPRQAGTVFHFDGEFNSMEDLVRATFTGRNFGWLPHEEKIAIKHIARIIREDNGKGELAQEFGGSYRKVLKGTAKDLPEALRLPKAFRLDVDKASEQQIVNAVAKLVAAYVTDLTFAMDDKGHYIGSPYDEFLKINNLPRKPNKNEPLAAYNQRLLKAINNLQHPRFVTAGTKKFASHKQEFVFSAKELQGMKLFFRNGNKKQSGGNCASCHTAPHFSDFGFHNSGLMQHNYDAIHDYGAFLKLAIPSLKQRNANYDDFLPATSKHTTASSRFRSIPAKDKPGYVDLGLWNVFANPDMPAPQEKLKTIMCSHAKTTGNKNCSNEALLENTIAAFKTPVLRDLGHSGPYMHTGQFEELSDVVMFYMSGSSMAKINQLRNRDPALLDIKLTEKDIEPLVAFLKSLNEDYD